ncbi:hypothetical protein D3C85_1197870 [compost metagenome]
MTGCLAPPVCASDFLKASSSVALSIVAVAFPACTVTLDDGNVICASPLLTVIVGLSGVAGGVSVDGTGGACTVPVLTCKLGPLLDQLFASSAASTLNE